MMGKRGLHKWVFIRVPKFLPKFLLLVFLRLWRENKSDNVDRGVGVNCNQVACRSLIIVVLQPTWKDQ